jgi:hypothetical protein
MRQYLWRIKSLKTSLCEHHFPVFTYGDLDSKYVYIMDAHQIPLPKDDVLPAQANRAVQLTPFWAPNLAAQCATAEGSYRLRNIAYEESCFFNCQQDFLDAMEVLIADLVETVPLPANPYMELCYRLLTVHQLTDIQHVEQLANQKPSRCCSSAQGARRTTPSSTTGFSTSAQGALYPAL